MKAAALVLAFLLALTHPAAAVTVLAFELGGCAAVCCLIVRAARPLCLPALTRRTS